jgi:hypothetical protein
MRMRRMAVAQVHVRAAAVMREVHVRAPEQE